ncbi:MAG: type II secretion system protein [Gammaproteobacteria bacterium]
MHINSRTLSKSKEQGVSLIELILVMVVIILILVAVARYYESTRSSQRVNEGVNVMQMITNAAESWLVTYKTFQPKPLNDISMASLHNQALLPASVDKNPWGGSITITPITDKQQIKIEFDNINKPDCLSLCEIMNNKNVDGGDCTQNCVSSQGVGGVTYVGNYPKS